MRILLLSEPTFPHHGGGAGKAAHLFARGLAARGHEVSLLSADRRKEPAEESLDGIGVLRVPISWFPAGGAMSAPGAGQVVDFLESRGRPPVELVHDVGGFLAYFYSLAHALKERGARFVLNIQHLSPAYTIAHEESRPDYDGTHDAFSREFAWWHSVAEPSQCLAVRLADLVLSPSASEADQLRVAYAPEPGRLSVLPNPVPLEIFELAEAPRADPRWSGSLVFGGRLDDPVKGADVVAAAFRRVLDALPETRLVLVAGSIPKVLRPFEASIDLTGWLVDDREVGRALRQGCALLMPSRYEAFGMLAAEAMAVGVPAIVSRAGGLSEIVAHGETGYVLGDDQARWPEEMAGHALGLLGDTDAAIRMGGRAAGSVRDLAHDLLAARLESLYARVLEGSAASGGLHPPRADGEHDILLRSIVSRLVGAAALQDVDDPFAPTETDYGSRCPPCTRARLSAEAVALTNLRRRREFAVETSAAWRAETAAATAHACPFGLVQRVLFDRPGAGGTEL